MSLQKTIYPVLIALSAAGPACSERPLQPVPQVEAQCESSTSPGFALVDTGVRDAVRGPCGRVAYEKQDGSLWLYEPDGAAPRQLEAQASNPVFAQTGTSLAYLTPDAIRLYDLSTHAMSATLGRGREAGAFAFVYGREASTPSEILFVEDAASLTAVDRGGAIRGISTAALGGAFHVLTWARDGANVVVKKDDGALASIDLASEKLVPLAGLEYSTSFADERADRVYLSRDGLFLVYQKAWSRPCGDTVCPELDTSSQIVRTDSGRLVGAAAPVGDGGPLEAESEDAGHVLGIAGAQSFDALDAQGKLRSFPSLLLRGLLGDDQAIAAVAEDSDWPHRSYQLVELSSGARREILIADDDSLASSADGRYFAGSRFSDQCLLDPGGESCGEQLWDLVAASPEGQASVLATATQPIDVQWVSGSRALLVYGPLFEGAPPAVADPAVPATWHEYLIRDGAKQPLSLPPLESVHEVGGVLAAVSRESSTVRLWSIDPQTGAVAALASGDYDVSVSTDRAFPSLVVLIGSTEGQLWAGLPAQP